MMTLLISMIAFGLGMYEGDKILQGKDTLTVALYDRVKEILNIN